MTKTKRTLRIPFRVKIMTLVATILVTSFTSYLWLGSSLIIRDKSSYIYDFNLGIVDRVSESISTRIETLRNLARVLDSTLELGEMKLPETAQRSFAAAFSQMNASLIPKQGLLILRATNPMDFKAFLAFPPDNSSLAGEFAAAHWTPSDFENVAVRIGIPHNRTLPIAIRMRDAKGQPAVMFSTLKLSLGFVSHYSKKTWIEVLGPDGARLENMPWKGNYASSAFQEDLASFERSIAKESFPSGVREIRLGGEDYLASYEHVNEPQGTAMTVLGLTSKTVAFAAARMLRTESLLLAITILSLGLLFALIFARRVTSRLRTLWMATRRLGAGDLKARIPDSITKRGRDELSEVSCSFNTMAAQIESLVQETAEKARMKAELETAQTVQSRFLPQKGYASSIIKIYGSSLPATECAGDWWQYREIGPYLFVVVGDVTGHGVSSALVTAAAHGAFSIAMEEFREEFEKLGRRPDLNRLMRKLDQAIQATGGEQASMTAVLSLIDMTLGTISTLNASHPNPFLHRHSQPHQGQSLESGIRLLNQTKIMPLGMQPEDHPVAAETRLQSGDKILLYTDGLLECNNDSGEVMHKKTLLKKWTELDTKDSGDPSAALMGEFKAFLGTKGSSPDDDITTVIIEVSDQAESSNQDDRSQAA